ncbi:MAG: flagellar basal-body rod protein FlgG [Phycisphaerae bacterium]|nr:flagellar basal-body rod protein FlgG [Phycisphaerae bacterium]
MAITALQSAASALSALNTALDVTANNLANVNTTGFKASRANFQDLLYIEKSPPGAENASGDQAPTGLYVGLGTKVSGTQVNFTTGNPQTTSQPLDVMIDGLGFFRVSVQPELGTGVAYTRAGNFALNRDRQMVLASDQGRRVDPPIEIPENAVSVKIDADGRVLVTSPGSVEPTEVGRFEIANFVNPAGLKQVGENLFVETVASGPPIAGNPAEENRGQLRQGILESSNVDPTTELITLIRTQRAFEMNSQTIRAADDTLREVAQLRR